MNIPTYIIIYYIPIPYVSIHTGYSIIMDARRVFFLFFFTELRFDRIRIFYTTRIFYKVYIICIFFLTILPGRQYVSNLWRLVVTKYWCDGGVYRQVTGIYIQYTYRVFFLLLFTASPQSSDHGLHLGTDIVKMPSCTHITYIRTPLSPRPLYII